MLIYFLKAIPVVRTFEKIEGVYEISPTPFVEELRKGLQQALEENVTAICLASNSGKLAEFRLTTDGSPYFTGAFRGKTVTFVQGERYASHEYAMFEEEPHSTKECYAIGINTRAFPHSLSARIPGTEEWASWRQQRSEMHEKIGRIVEAAIEKSDLPVARV